MRLVYNIIIIVACFLLLSCSLFEPRDNFEQPQRSFETEPFRFNDILQGPRSSFDEGIRFTSNDLNEIFGNTFVYCDVNMTDKKFDKTSMINRLSQIDKPEMVTWEFKGGDYECTRRGDTVFIQGLEYTMTFKSRAAIKGESKFEIVNNRYWQITLWENNSNLSIQSELTPLQ